MGLVAINGNPNGSGVYAGVLITLVQGTTTFTALADIEIIELPRADLTAMTTYPYSAGAIPGPGVRADIVVVADAGTISGCGVTFAPLVFSPSMVLPT